MVEPYLKGLFSEEAGAVHHRSSPAEVGVSPPADGPVCLSLCAWLADCPGSSGMFVLAERQAALSWCHVPPAVPARGQCCRCQGCFAGPQLCARWFLLWVCDREGTKGTSGLQ